MIARGTYTARAGSFEFGVTAKDSDFVSVEFEIRGGPAHVGERIGWRGYFTEKTTDRTLESLKHAGWDGRDVMLLQGLGSRDCQIVVDHEEYDGKTYARVQWVNAHGGGGLGPGQQMDEARKRAFAARMRRFTGGAPAGAPTAPAAAFEEDDIPF